MSMSSGPEPACREADVSAEYLEGFRSYLLAVARRELGPDLACKVGASDLVQETLFAAQGEGASFRGTSPDDLRAWLKGILRHQLANTRRYFRDTARRRVGIEVPIASLAPDSPVWTALADTGTSASGQAVRRELNASMALGLARLPERHRQVLVWRYQEGLTFEAIGARLGTSADAARKLWGRAIVRMREAMGPADDSR